MKVVRQEVYQGFTLAITTPDGPREYAAQVPGVIHTDLIAAGHIVPPDTSDPHCPV